jgi:single-strand DNA-binding protein
MNLNKVFLVGNLTRDPEARTTTSGQAVSSFGLATNRVFNDTQGQKQQQTEFHNVVAFGKLAEICNQYLNKGKLILIEGRLNTRSWEGQDGVKKFRTEIIAERMQMGPRGGGGQTTQTMNNQPNAADLPTIDAENEEINAKDIPF